VLRPYPFKRWLGFGWDEVAAAVLGVALFAGLHAEGLFLAEADGVHAIAGDAESDEIRADGIGAAYAESQVVFGGAAFVAVAFDGDAGLRIVLEEVGGLGEILASVGTNLGGIVIEVGVANFLVKEFFPGFGARGRGSWRRSADVDGDAGGGVTCGAAGGERIGCGRSRRDGRGALRGDRANFGSDGNVGGVGGGPGKFRGVAGIDGSAIGGKGSGGLGGSRGRSGDRRWSYHGLFVAARNEDREGEQSDEDGAIVKVRAERLNHTSPPGQ